MSDQPTTPIPAPHPTPTQEQREERRDRDESARSDQIGIIPGKVPGHPTDPGDPRFPGSQPDLA